MRRDRSAMSAKASSSTSMPPSTMAEICPRENPSTRRGTMPRASSARAHGATDSAAMAIWASRVSFSSSATRRARAPPRRGRARPRRRRHGAATSGISKHIGAHAGLLRALARGHEHQAQPGPRARKGGLHQAWQLLPTRAPGGCSARPHSPRSGRPGPWPRAPYRQ